jgi:hypothetical protein
MGVESRLDVLGNVCRMMRIAGVGCMLGFPVGKEAGQDFNATTGVPINGTKGWGPAAQFLNFKGSAGSLVYYNTGTNTSSVWTNVL